MKNTSEMRVRRSQLLRLNGRSDVVFNLFDPVGERKWAEGWNPTFIYPKSGVHQGSVFTTTDHDGNEAIWIVTKLDRNGQSIVYSSVMPGFKVSIIEIICQPNGADHTKTRVTYTITALSEKGKQYVTSMSKQHYEEWMTSWEKAINHYLRHGQRLRHH
jgi:hypothetical protein